ncbi:MAG: helix-turn-helix domain-containing protein [Kiritimatiellia bacterium]
MTSNYFYLHADRGPEATLDHAITVLEKALHISITMHDPYGKLMLLPNKPLLSRRHASHRNKYLCGAGFCDKCREFCGVKTNQRAAESTAPFINECWKGLAEIVIPIHHDGTHLATLFAGTWRARPRPYVRFRGRTIAWEQRWANLSGLSDDQADKLMVLLSVFGRGLFSDIDAWIKAGCPAASRAQEIRRFLRMSNPGASHIRDLAGHLHISPSRTSHLVSELFGVSFQDMLQRERVNRACLLLANTDLPIKEIAFRTGLESQYYFSRLFKKVTGHTPTDYRRTKADPPGNG